MKTPAAVLCLAVLVSACSPTPADPTRAAVTAYLRKTLDDPASYQPVRFGAAAPYLRTEAGRQELGQLMAAYKVQQDSVIDYIRGEAADSEVARLKATADVLMQRAGVLGKVIDRQEAAKDTARVGVAVRHSFRAKNKLGALVLDSARFLVATTGAVQVLP